MKTLRDVAYLVQLIFQRLALILFVLCALALTAASIMAGLGMWPWITLDMSLGGEPVAYAGMYAQIALTVLAIGLCFFLPSNRRIMQLENSHRAFNIGMNDVARAYAAVHAADRGDTFHLSSEFDAVRERLAYLRSHPDLSSLEPAILEIAAQMSHISRELAEVYSDDKVARARSFLKERQEEVERFNERLEHAKSVATDLRHWVHQVELEESVAAAQLTRLKEDLHDMLPELAMGTRPQDFATVDNTVVDLQAKAAE